MILKSEIDESYLSVPHRRSRVGGHFYFGNTTDLDKIKPTQGTVHDEYSIIKPVFSLVAEASIASLLIISKK